MNKKLFLFSVLSVLIALITCKELEKSMLVSTGEVSNINTNTADASGVVVDLGDGAIQHGHCYGTSPNVTTSGSKTQLGTPPAGGFTSQLTNLTAGTKYYIKAYISDGAETVYGKEISFTTDAASVPTVSTTEVFSVTTLTAASGGNVTNDGGVPVTARGVCYGTSAGPTTEGIKTSDGTGTGSYTSSLSGLTPNTTYYIRAYATNSAGTSYGSELSFTTNTASPPVLSTEAITSITQTTAFSGGNITSDGGVPVTVRGICWNSTGSPSTSDNKTEDGAGTGSFTSSLSGLTGNTMYYVRAYATNLAGTSYGEEVSFTTGSVIPAVTTAAITLVTSTTASGGGNITSNGGSVVTARGVCWNTSALPTVANSKTTDGTGSGSFSSNITGLTASTAYYVRAYATNGEGTAYGSEVSFTTNAVTVVEPSLTTAAITGITQTTAVSGGTITSNGGSTVTVRGVCWSTSSNPTISGSKTTDGSGSGVFESTLTGLTANTTYYVRSYATNGVGTAYGNELSFTTSVIPGSAPTVTTSAIGSVTSTTAISGGNVSSDGGTAVTARGVCWSTSINPTTADSKTVNGTGTGSFASNITNLNPVTTYYVRAYATNGSGTGYGNQLSLTTNAATPTLTTTEMSAVTATTASSGGNITSDGGALVTSRGVCWSTSANPTVADLKTSDGVGMGIFTSTLTGLAGNTNYYVRAYATNNVGTAYGNQLQFTTPGSIPTITTDAISSITKTTANAGGVVTAEGGSPVYERGVCYATLSNPTTANSKIVSGSGPGSFAVSLTGLIAGTNYHLRAYAANTTGTAYGNEQTFTTQADVPYISTAAVTSISQTTATSGGNISNDGGSIVTERGICYSTTSNPSTSDQKIISGTGSGTYASIISGLIPGTKYYVKAYAINSIGTAYGNELSFTTNAALATITTSIVTSITKTAGTSGGNIISDGGSTVTERGICYSTITNPTTSDTKVLSGSGTGSFSAEISGLIAGTNYYVRAYAINSVGTAYGDNQLFTTSPDKPGINTSDVTFITSSTATAGGTVTYDGGYAVSDRGVCYAITPNPITTDSKISSGTGTGTFSVNLSSLTPATNYYLRAFATNSLGTSYGNEVPFVTNAALATVTTNTIGSITQTTASGGGNISTDGGSPVTERGICYSISVNPTTDNNKVISGSGSGSFTANLSGLIAGTGYYVRAYAVNSIGTAYGNLQYFTTSPSNPTVSTANITVFAQTTATCNGEVITDGGAAVTERGICYSTTPNPTISSPKVTSGSGTGTFSVNLTSLSPGVTYYVKAYGINSVGPGYGTEKSFTTTVYAPTATTLAANLITVVSATLNGNVNANNAGTTVTFEYGTSISYTNSVNAAQSPLTGVSGTPVNSSITGLAAGTTYHFRVKAVNSGGTTYGNDLTFTTVPATVTDADLNVYNTITIGTQVWFRENLKTTKYRDGTPILDGSSVPDYSGEASPKYYFNYNYDLNNVPIYGRLYTWYTITDSRNVCPTGWHIPTDFDFAALSTYLGTDAIAGGKMKETGTVHWTTNSGATNESGFTGLPGGARFPTGYTGLGTYGRFWSGTEFDATTAWFRSLSSDNTSLSLSKITKQAGFSVRCLKD